jgi:hypothetical protein
VLSIIAYPMIHTYQNGGAIDTFVTQTKYGVYSLANLGYSTVQCGTMPFNQKELTLSCPYGRIEKIVNQDQGFGVTPFDSDAVDACLRDEQRYQNDECS